MQAAGVENGADDFVVIHPLAPEDEPVVTAMRAATAPAKGRQMEVGARGQFNAFMASVQARSDVAIEPDTVGGIPGFWVMPSKWRPDEAILHLHGGWFNFGSAEAFCNLVGHIAANAGARAFIPDYRLAPEHPFPAATDDVRACYQGLHVKGIKRCAIVGDSAGGNLALVLASRIAGVTAVAETTLVGVALLSPITDLSLSGSTYETRADADPLFTRAQVTDLVCTYLAGTDARHPLASPLFGRLSGLPPTRIHVGDNEVLLADSLRFVGKAAAAGVDVRADVWLGMPHGYVGSVGRLQAADRSLTAVGQFLSARFQAHTRLRSS